MPFFDSASHAVPLFALATGVNIKHPLAVRFTEALVLGVVSGAITLFIGVKMLEKDMSTEKGRLDAHIARYEAQVIKRDAEIARGRLEQQAGVAEIVRKLERIEDCIRLRTCTK